jgi:cytochrome c oxidase subunit 2
VQQKWWSFLFGGVMLAATLSVVITPFVGWGLPKNVSSYGGQVDWLFHLILFVTGFFFILTQVILVYFMYAFSGRVDPPTHPKPVESGPQPGTFFRRVSQPLTPLIPDEHRLEMVWTIIPGVILFILAVVQIRTWLEIKDRNWMPNPDEQPLQIEVSARQFEWRVRYPSPDRMDKWESDPKLAADFRPRRYLDTTKKPNVWIDNAGVHEDDIYVVNEVHTWAHSKERGAKVLVQLITRDVIHSFYLPNLRLKQDALPGKVIPVWFEATEPNTKLNEETGKWEDGYDFVKGTWGNRHQIWELVCAELCGWGHYKMQGRLYVHENKDDFMEWLKHAEEEQRKTKP